MFVKIFKIIVHSELEALLEVVLLLEVYVDKMDVFSFRNINLHSGKIIYSNKIRIASAFTAQASPPADSITLANSRVNF